MMDKKKRNTLLLIAALAVIIGIAALTQNMPRTKSGGENGIGEQGSDDKNSVDPGMVAVIQQEGQILMEIPLGEDRDFVVQHPNGGYNAVRVKDGRICVTDADCPDLTCVRTGNAWEAGQVIACLPHRLIIYIDQGK